MFFFFHWGIIGNQSFLSLNFFWVRGEIVSLGYFLRYAQQSKAFVFGLYSVCQIVGFFFLTTVLVIKGQECGQ